MEILSIQDLTIEAHGTEIIKNLSLLIQEGETHVIMGPNGSGKSTLVSGLMGHPGVEIKRGSIVYKGSDITSSSPSDRSKMGIFLAMQHPREIQGVTLKNFLYAILNAHQVDGKKISPITFQKKLKEILQLLSLDESFLGRSLNVGFSGGEKKKCDILQMLMLSPTLRLLDETDSGLDIDALNTVTHAINTTTTPNSATLLVTHYTRILNLIKPTHVHVMVKGNIVDSGGPELAHSLESKGYTSYQEK